MRDQSQQRLQQILKRLGQALHGSAVNSKGVRQCLRELNEEGWDGVMMLSAALACRRDGSIEVDHASLHVHADDGQRMLVPPQLTSEDAAFLRQLGIEPRTSCAADHRDIDELQSD